MSITDLLVVGIFVSFLIGYAVGIKRGKERKLIEILKIIKGEDEK